MVLFVGVVISVTFAIVGAVVSTVTVNPLVKVVIVEPALPALSLYEVIENVTSPFWPDKTVYVAV